jgi:hypothetical protein
MRSPDRTARGYKGAGGTPMRSDAVRYAVRYAVQRFRQAAPLSPLCIARRVGRNIHVS